MATVLSNGNADNGIRVKKIAGSLGAEIENVDLRNLNDSTTKDIRQALLDHKVIFFRKQDLSPQEFLSFSSHFGKPVEYPFVKGIDGYPEIIQVLKREHEQTNFGGVWHCDTLYLEEPPMGTILLARELPPYGGDTLFANQVAAYDTLSDGLKATLSTLTGVNTSAKADASKTREDRIKDSGHKTEDLISHHPAVRTHPETGRKSIYVNVAHTERFDGWTNDESAPLLKFLFEHQVKPEFTCRFRWEPGSIAFWDNRAALHNPINDYHGFKRSMHRITLAGDKPR
jgi:taurine dioxygenase